MMKDDDCVVGMDILSEDKFVLTVSETGLGRLSPISEYPIHSRATQGQNNFKVDKYGYVVSVQSVDINDDLMMISANGVIVRIPINSITPHSRTSRGVSVMKLDEGDRLISAVPVSKAGDEIEHDSEAEAPGENPAENAEAITGENSEA